MVVSACELAAVYSPFFLRAKSVYCSSMPQPLMTQKDPSMTHADIKFVLHFLGVGFGHVCVIKKITTDL